MNLILGKQLDSFIHSIPISLARLREDLNSDIRDAPSNQFFAGLYEGYVFPGEGEHPCKGLFTSELFINVCQSPILYSVTHFFADNEGDISRAQLRATPAICEWSAQQVGEEQHE